MSPDRARGLVDLQCAALDHLARLAPGLALPRVHHARSGAQVVEVDDPDGRRRLAWMLTWVEGQTLASTRPHAAELLVSVGSLLARMDGALESFDHPAADRDLSWAVARAGWIRTSLDAIPHPGRRATVAHFLALYDDTAAPVLAGLRRSVIHGDANDHNVIVHVPRARSPRAVSVIDFGDMLRTATVCEPAVRLSPELIRKAGFSDATEARLLNAFNSIYKRLRSGKLRGEIKFEVDGKTITMNNPEIRAQIAFQRVAERIIRAHGMGALKGSSAWASMRSQGPLVEPGKPRHQLLARLNEALNKGLKVPEDPRYPGSAHPDPLEQPRFQS